MTDFLTLYNCMSMRIVLKRAATAVTVFLLVVTAARAQNIKVSGKVTDAATGEPVVGAALLVKGLSAGAMTDASGVYSIAVDPGATLVCTCIGYADAEQAVGGRTVIDFVLAEDAEMLDETVVVGYGTLKKSQLVGSVEQISGEVLEDRVNANVSRTLQGQVPGLSIFQVDGKPTHGGSVYIRGGATNYVMKKNMSSKDLNSYEIGQGGSALVLIDGVEGELSSVNPDDIVNQYRGAACDPVKVSAVTGEGVDALRERLAGRVHALAGQSGAGKSTLINALYGLTLETGDLSRKIDRGKNTTRSCELIPVSGGGMVLDTPGFSLLETDVFDPVEIKDSYPEFAPLEGGCFFQPCYHASEPRCAVRDAVRAGEIDPKRHGRYVELLNDMRQRWRERYD